MQVGPKYKICKRLGSSVFEKCQTQKFQVAEARTPRRRKRRDSSDYSTQLLEKQKARFTYGISETQFSRYAHEAMEKRGGDSKQNLLARLESRLDNVVYRTGFMKTRRAARQLVSHGHVTVNGRRVTIPSFGVKINDVIAIRPESRGSALFRDRAEVATEQKLPSWAVLDGQGFVATMSAQPDLNASEATFDVAKIIQFYSR